jgi:hypothetical protein
LATHSPVQAEATLAVGPGLADFFHIAALLLPLTVVMITIATEANNVRWWYFSLLASVLLQLWFYTTVDGHTLALISQSALKAWHQAPNCLNMAVDWALSPWEDLVFVQQFKDGFSAPSSPVSLPSPVTITLWPELGSLYMHGSLLLTALFAVNGALGCWVAKTVSKRSQSKFSPFQHGVRNVLVAVLFCHALWAVFDGVGCTAFYGVTLGDATLANFIWAPVCFTTMGLLGLLMDASHPRQLRNFTVSVALGIALTLWRFPGMRSMLTVAWIPFLAFLSALLQS